MFETKEKTEEARYAHGLELDFKAHARRDRMFGRWAAHLLGLHGESAEAYALQMMRDDVESAGDERVLDKVGDDLRSAGVDAAIFCKDRLRRKLERLAAVASNSRDAT